MFGGPSWTRVEEPDGSPGQWYYHLFAAEQPDLNWRNPEVVEEFVSVLRFWMDRGADGFRIDVSDALMKDDTFPDTATGEPIIPKGDDSPVHEVYREFRRVMDEYPGDRMAVIETGAEDDIVALFIRPDEMHLAFNFRFVHAGFDGPGLRAAIDSSLAANAGVGAPTTWVTDNHDTPRSVSRLGQNAVLTGAYVPGDDGLRGRSRRSTSSWAPVGPGPRPRPAGPARRGLHLQRPGAGPAQRRRPARRGPAGPDLGAQRAHSPRPRRMPGADAVDHWGEPRVHPLARPSRGCRSPRSGRRCPWPRSGPVATPCSASTARRWRCAARARPWGAASCAGCRPRTRPPT